MATKIQITTNNAELLQRDLKQLLWDTQQSQRDSLHKMTSKRLKMITKS